MTRPPPPQDPDAPTSRTHRPRGNAVVVAIVMVIGLALVVGVGAYSWRAWERRPSERPLVGLILVERPFSLVGPVGQPVTDKDLRGRFMLIYFGYTTCHIHCPTMLMMTAAALETLGPRARQVLPIFITVDPEHDPPEIMGRSTRRFSPRILGLTGSEAQIESVEKAFGVQTLFRRTGPQALAYVIDHPSGAYLVGPDGRFLAELPTEGGADDLAASIRRRLLP